MTFFHGHGERSVDVLHRVVDDYVMPHKFRGFESAVPCDDHDRNIEPGSGLQDNRRLAAAGRTGQVQAVVGAHHVPGKDIRQDFLPEHIVAVNFRDKGVVGLRPTFHTETLFDGNIEDVLDAIFHGDQLLVRFG